MGYEHGGSWWKSARAGWMAFALLALVLAAGTPRWISDAQAQNREPAPPAFLSGGARSEIVLREIAQILKRIDGRLERLERAVYAAAEEDQQPQTATEENE